MTINDNNNADEADQVAADDEPLYKRVFVAESDIHGRGLFAKVAMKKGRYIGTYEGPQAKRNGKYVLWLMAEGEGDEIGRRGLNLLRYLNHADEPNAEFDGWDLYAMKAIRKGAEITFNYEPELED